MGWRHSADRVQALDNAFVPSPRSPSKNPNSNRTDQCSLIAPASGDPEFSMPMWPLAARQIYWSGFPSES